MALSKKARKKFHETVDELFDLIDGLEEETEDDEEEASSKKGKGNKDKGKKDDDEDEDEGPTLNDVRKRARQYKNDWGKSEARKILKQYGVTSLASLDEEDYASVIKDMDDAEEEEE